MKTNSYDEIPYTKNIFQQTQPDNLATIATLFSMQSPPVETCRVLELGCASGINTIAMAQAIPNGEFIGIDFSEQQVHEGQNNIRRLELQNITLQQKNILDIDAAFGQFDYIVAHGVYSWVPSIVRDKVLQICQQNLQQNGVAYVSYNVYPGWHFDQTLRKMVLYHTRNITNPGEKLEKAKALINFFVNAIKHKYDSHSLLLRKELQKISQIDENYLFHEYLEENNTPVFFYEFIEHANRHGLQYLADTRTPFASLNDFSLEKTETLDINPIEKEQYFDFLRDTHFRETLLCHQAVSLNRHLEPNQINNFYIAAPLKPASPDKVTQEHQAEQFQNVAGESVLSVTSPLLKAVCLCLGDVWPQNLSFDNLIQRVSKLLRMLAEERGEQVDSSEKEYNETILSLEDIDEVKAMLLEFYLNKIVELSIYPPQFTLFISEYPIASPIARLQSTQGKQITNLRYEVFTLDFATRLVLRHLEGTHNRAALLEILQKSIEAGDLALYQGEDKQTLKEVNTEKLHNHLSSQIKEILQSLSQKAYLIA
ncbi:class I SAM-dependent methyltransferase [Candidatus Parabeggiatoa sp. HSG14]|uniref:class I SAM-dependent methyltransferase n=1 Tax=Candidatus Parabeggiatoa sp. HSG14 TaxID=3055593 RepID=UPI0025A8CB9D|nr:class I SAM-dependent methyltransferase [Thiotrichales bacterium HSG14]